MYFSLATHKKAPNCLCKYLTVLKALKGEDCFVMDQLHLSDLSCVLFHKLYQVHRVGLVVLIFISCSQLNLYCKKQPRVNFGLSEKSKK